MTQDKADEMVELLFRLVKNQRLMRRAVATQRELVYKASKPVIEKLVREFGGDRTWIEALLTFEDGQYFGQDTMMWIGAEMDEATVKDCLRREVYYRNNIAI